MRRDSTGIPSLFSDGKEFITARDKASILNNHFQSVFTSKDLSNIPRYHSSVSSMPPILFSYFHEGIDALLTKLDTRTLLAQIKIISYILRHYGYEVSPILPVIYYQSLYSGKLPSYWLMANIITPVFKWIIGAVQSIIC